MKIRPIVYWFVALAALSSLLILWFGNKKPTVSSIPSTRLSANAPPVSQTRDSARTNSSLAQARLDATVPPQSLSESKAAKMIGILSTYNDVPIDFYGKVQDQFSNAVPNTTVTFSVRVYNGTESSVKRGQVMTDANGRFNISGYKGESLGLAAAKDGYVLATTATFFKYSHLEDRPYEPDEANPTVLKMWKLQRPEPLETVNKTYRLPYDARPLYFDLLAGQTVTSGGDLEIKVNRPPGVISGRNPQDWGIELSVIDGGYIESSQQEASVTYEAPENGYQESGTFSKNNGPDLVDKMLFIKSRQGHIYGKIHLLFGINMKPDDFMEITLTGVVNTNGSRDWEATATQ